MAGENGKSGKRFYQSVEVVQTYLNPRLTKLFTAYAFTLSESRSSVSESIYKKFFNELPEKEINRLLRIFEEMTPEQKRNPGKREP